MTQTVNIRAAKESDTEQIMQFIIDLAVYEKEPDAVFATPEHIRQSLFCDNPKVHGLIAEIDGTAVGFAIYFFNFSTWLGKLGIYLEDLFVAPSARGAGAGKALLKKLAQIAVERDCGRVEWSVLDWNEPSIQFYKAMGAEAMSEWTVYRLDGEALLNFAAS